MARKTMKGMPSRMREGKVSIKYVKRARMWCKTWFEYSDRGGWSQRQEWSENKPE